MNADTNRARVFGEVLVAQLKEAAADLRRAADELDGIADNVTNIGTTLGISHRPMTATDLAAQAVRALHRNNPNLSGLVLSAADYDRNVRPTDTTGDNR
jgi:hypothetical protein